MKFFCLSSVILFLAGLSPVTESDRALAAPSVAPDRTADVRSDRGAVRSTVFASSVTPTKIDVALPTVMALPTTTTTTTTTAPPTTTTTAPKRTTTTAAQASSGVARNVAATPAAERAPEPKAPATTTPSAAKPTGNGKGKQEVARIVRAQVGKAYVRGATGPNAFDCSGLVFYAYNQAGISMPRLTDAGYYARSTKISRGDLQPGDLIKFSGHMGIYVGNGQMVHASTPRGGVKLSSIDSPGRPTGYGRLG